MSLTDRPFSYLISDNADLLAGTPVLADEVAVITPDGWDQLTRTMIHRAATMTPEDVAALYPQGAQLGTRKWWINGAKPTRIAAGLWRVEVSFLGWAYAKPAKVSVDANADQQSGTNILAPDYPGDTVGTLYAKLEAHENMPTIAVSYLVENVDADGRTHEVSTAQTPPVSIPVAPSVWSFLTTYIFHFPNGWVLMSSAQDRIPGSTAAMVTDNYKFIRDKTPG